MESTAPIQVGDRFTDNDPRHEGRVVEVTETRGPGRFQIITEVNPNNPAAVGRKSTVSEHSLRRRFERLTH